MSTLIPMLVFQPMQADNSGRLVPIPYGKLWCYQAGTNIPQAVFADPSGSVPLPNPVILDAAGIAKIYLADLAYKFLLTDAHDVAVFPYPVDGVQPSAAVVAFREDLQDYTINTKGGALVGYNGTLTYPARTVGNQLKIHDTFLTDLGNFTDGSKGAAKVGFGSTITYPAGTVGAALTQALTFPAGDLAVATAQAAVDLVQNNRIAAVELGQNNGVTGYATQALLYADLSPDDKAVAYVTNDATPSKNGTYRKSGAPGSGSWIQSSYDRVALVETKATTLDKASSFNTGTDVVFQYVRKLRIYNANPLKYYYVTYFFRDDVGTRFTMTLTQADNSSGLNAVDVATFSTTGTTYSGLQEFTLAALTAAGITADLVIDFTTTPATWAFYAGTWLTGGVRNTTLVTSPADTAYYGTMIDTALANLSIKGLNKPFADTLNNTFLRKIMRDVHLYGADTSHTYIISTLEIANYRCKFIVRDITAGVDVCELAVTRSIPDYTTLPRWWKAYQGALATDSAMYCVVDFDWTQAVPGLYNYTTVAESGIHPDNVFSDEMIADYLYKDQWHEIIPVGVGQTYTTINAALASLVDEASVELIQGCGRSCYHHQILIDLVDAAIYPVKNANFPEFVSLRGRGRDKTFINSLDTSHYALLQMHRDTKFIDCTITSDTGDGVAYYGEYCVHSDDVNYKSITQKNRRLRQLVKRVTLNGGPNQSQWLWGCGISGGETIRFEDVTGGHQNMASTSPTFGFHNTSLSGTRPSYLPSIVEMLGCRSTDERGGAVGVISLGAGNRSVLSLLGNNQFSLVYQAVTDGIADKAADRYEWEIGGTYDGPIVQNDGDMVVLKTTAGLTPSGTAAALIFGTMDELGRGDLCISDGSTNVGRSLGARLGDCSSVNKSLTIGAQTVIFSTNLTAVSNATIINSINAVITLNPVSEKNIQYEIYPDTGYTRRMMNSTGATILAGAFVKHAGANSIDHANGTDDVWGWTYRDILNGYAGNVVTTRRISDKYIPEATGNGKFGITAGRLDYAATTKVGYVRDGIVYLYN